jgi:hypothetical protein
LPLISSCCDACAAPVKTPPSLSVYSVVWFVPCEFTSSTSVLVISDKVKLSILRQSPSKKSGALAMAHMDTSAVCTGCASEHRCVGPFSAFWSPM